MSEVPCHFMSDLLILTLFQVQPKHSYIAYGFQCQWSPSVASLRFWVNFVDFGVDILLYCIARLRDDRSRNKETLVMRVVSKMTSSLTHLVTPLFI